MIISACNIISLGSYATKHDTIYVSDSKIYKPDGSELIMKGVNTIDVYYLFQQNDYRRGKNISIAVYFLCQIGCYRVVKELPY